MSNSKKMLLIIVSATLVSLILINYYGKKLNTQLYNYINAESRRIIINIVNDSINKVLEKNNNYELFNITKNEEGKVELLEYNTQQVNKLLKQINQNIEQQLLALEDGKTSDLLLDSSFKNRKYTILKNGIICEIPMGSLKNNAFYSNYGPNIPIKMTFQGSVNSKIKTKLTEYGFNSIVIEVFIISEIESKISLPISSELNKINIEAPLTLKIIQGTVPDKYYEKQLEKSYQQ